LNRAQNRVISAAVKSREAFEEDISTGKMPLGVIGKMPDGIEN
jgi:hypothetical protein